MYNLQLMVNAFAIENEVVNHINNNIADIEAKINTRLAKYRAAENAATKSAEGSETETISSVEQPPVASKFADIKLAKEYELAGTDEQHIDLLSQIPLEGGRGAVDLRAKPQAAGQINKIEVKATFKYFSGMPKATNFHGAEIVAVYSMLLKRLYFYYNIERKTNAKDLNKKSYVRVASINCAIPCVKILPEGIRVVDY